MVVTALGLLFVLAGSPAQASQKPLSYEVRLTLAHKLVGAVQQGDVVRVKDLLRKGADPDGKPNGGTPPWMYLGGSIPQRLAVAKLLLDAGASLEAPANSNGETPLMAVARDQEAVPLLEFYLARGAKPNATKRDGETALHIAVASRNLPGVRTLLKHGADPSAGRTMVFRLDSATVSGKSIPGVAGKEIRVQADKPTAIPGLRTSAGKGIRIRYSYRALPNRRWQKGDITLGG